MGKKIETREDLCKLTKKLLNLSLKLHEEACRYSGTMWGTSFINDNIFSNKDIDKLNKIAKEIKEFKKHIENELSRDEQFNDNILDDMFNNSLDDFFEDLSALSNNDESSDSTDKKINLEDLVHKCVEKYLRDKLHIELEESDESDESDEIDFSVDMEALKNFFGED